MSRFFAGSSSDEESDVESQSEEGSEVEQDAPVKAPGKFLKGATSDSDDSSDDENAKRVVRSARDRRYDELNGNIASIRNALKIADWKEIENDFEKLQKSFAKASAVIQKDGIPKQFLAILVELEDFLKDTLEKKPKMSAPNTKSFNNMKQKLKKHNKTYETQIEEYRKNPSAGAKKGDESEDDVEFSDDEKDRSESESEDETEKPKKAVEKVEVKKPTEMKPEEVKAKLKEILADRGKRNTDPAKQVERLVELFPFAKEVQLQVEILVHTVSSQFDTRSVSSHMSVALWKSTFQNLIKILDILQANPSVTLFESDEPEQAGGDVEVEDDNKQVSGNLMAFVERLDDEFTKSLQSIDPHTQEYVQRLQDENNFLELAERVQTYYERAGKMKRCARIAARRVEHIYYKLDVTESNNDNKVLLDKLTNLIYALGDERLKARTILCHIYYHALHGRFFEARDMMLMSHLQESISHMDIATQILFNRTMVQMGLCAFRCNMIKQAHSCLSEMYSSGRVKELLAQGVTSARHNEKNPEQEKLERKRQLPYHMHINLELLEAVHLITAMLLEVPNMAFNAYDPRKKIISKTFRRYLDIHDRQIFTGPPENTREVIIHASKALATGDWKKCEQSLLALPVWNLLHNSDQVKAMLRSKIQEEGLRTYLFTYGQHYDSLSLDHLCQMFELKPQNIHQIVSKMMINEEIHASWDQPSQCIVMHKGVDPTRLQYLSQQFADKAAQFVENNERLLDTRTGGYGYKYDQKQQKGDGQTQPYRQYTQYGQQGGDKQYQRKKKQTGGNKNQGNERTDKGPQRQQNRNRGANFDSNQ